MGPLKILLTPFILLTLSIPLAVFATVTSVIAIGALLLRVINVYFVILSGVAKARIWEIIQGIFRIKTRNGRVTRWPQNPNAGGRATGRSDQKDNFERNTGRIKLSSADRRISGTIKRNLGTDINTPGNAPHSIISTLSVLRITKVLRLNGWLPSLFSRLNKESQPSLHSLGQHQQMIVELEATDRNIGRYPEPPVTSRTDVSWSSSVTAQPSIDSLLHASGPQQGVALDYVSSPSPNLQISTTNNDTSSGVSLGQTQEPNPGLDTAHKLNSDIAVKRAKQNDDDSQQEPISHPASLSRENKNDHEDEVILRTNLGSDDLVTLTASPADPRVTLSDIFISSIQSPTGAYSFPCSCSQAHSRRQSTSKAQVLSGHAISSTLSATTSPRRMPSISQGQVDVGGGVPTSTIQRHTRMGRRLSFSTSAKSGSGFQTPRLQSRHMSRQPSVTFKSDDEETTPSGGVYSPSHVRHMPTLRLKHNPCGGNGNHNSASSIHPFSSSAGYVPNMGDSSTYSSAINTPAIGLSPSHSPQRSRTALYSHRGSRAGSPDDSTGELIQRSNVPTSTGPQVGPVPRSSRQQYNYRHFYQQPRQYSSGYIAHGFGPQGGVPTTTTSPPAGNPTISPGSAGLIPRTVHSTRANQESSGSRISTRRSPQNKDELDETNSKSNGHQSQTSKLDNPSDEIIPSETVSRATSATAAAVGTSKIPLSEKPNYGSHSQSELRRLHRSAELLTKLNISQLKVRLEAAASIAATSSTTTSLKPPNEKEYKNLGGDSNSFVRDISLATAASAGGVRGSLPGTLTPRSITESIPERGSAQALKHGNTPARRASANELSIKLNSLSHAIGNNSGSGVKLGEFKEVPPPFSLSSTVSPS